MLADARKWSPLMVQSLPSNIGLGPAQESEIAERVGRLTLDQKVRLLTGADFWSIPAEPSVGLRRVVLSDGPVGVRGELWDEREPSAAVPAPVALGATWDEQSVGDIGRVLAAEAVRKGANVVLAPVVNLVRSAFAGRNFEYFGEDPLLSARLGVAYARELQDAGVAATPKHFVANDSERERFTLNAIVDERTLRELYLAPFEAVVREVRPWAAMAAYNSVNGTTMTEHPMLRDVLSGEWGFDGVVMTDWFAGRSTVASARAGLDLVMPGPLGPWGDQLASEVRAGHVTEAAIDEKVERVLRLAARVGCLEGVAPATKPRRRPPDAYETSAILRRVATRGMVLLRNERDLLPLKGESLTRVAVIGPNAVAPRVLGGGSATVYPRQIVDPAAGLRSALGAIPEIELFGGAIAGAAPVELRDDPRIDRAPMSLLRQPNGSAPGIELEFAAPDGTILRREARTTSRLTFYGSYGGGLRPGDVGAITMRSVVTAPEGGTYQVGCSGTGHFVLTIDGRAVLDATLAPDPSPDPVDGLIRLPQRAVATDLEAGQSVLVEARLTLEPGRSAVRLELNIQPPVPDIEEMRSHASDLAAAADVAIVVVGTTERVESEGFDRRTLSLPAGQDELVAAVAAANPRTIVVVNAGSPVLLPWLEDVAAVLVVWFPGEAFGDALADVLLGIEEPGGRLPVTWPAAEDEAVLRTRPTDGYLRYSEGLHIGHRRWEQLELSPAFWFGHGLSYTSWAYEALEIEDRDQAEPDSSVLFQVRVRNCGSRRGREVVQLYASRQESGVDRPRHWLAGFTIVTAEPGETVDARVNVSSRAFEHWDSTAHGWATEPGTFTLEVGRSVGDLRICREIRFD
jgi:beta-glucosidase